MNENIKIIAFDADDTLWSNEPFFREVETRFCELLKTHGKNSNISSELFKTEMQNLRSYGYGAKAFTLSMIETALRVSGGNIPGKEIEKILGFGKELLEMPIQLLDGVTETLRALNGKYKLIVATKGDLLDQQRKLERSGIVNFFDHIEIMSDKTPLDYRKLIRTLNIRPENFLMVGNSLKSDILPVLEIGGKGIYIPFHITWQHEITEEKIQHPHFKKTASIREIPSLLQ